MNGYLLLLLLAALGFICRSPLISIAALLLCGFKLLNWQYALQFLQQRGIQLGLLFLLLAILTPVAARHTTWHQLAGALFSPTGLLTVLVTIIATQLNGEGLKLLQLEPALILSIVIGSVLGIVFFGGIPVGPLMAAGLAALVLEVLSWIRD